MHVTSGSVEITNRKQFWHVPSEASWILTVFRRPPPMKSLPLTSFQATRFITTLSLLTCLSLSGICSTKNHCCAGCVIYLWSFSLFLFNMILVPRFQVNRVSTVKPKVITRSLINDRSFGTVMTGKSKKD